MNEKNLPDDINSKSLNELTELANKIIEKLENEKDLGNSIDEYHKLLKLKILSKKNLIKPIKKFQKLQNQKLKILF